ncbi:hypothetical protein L1D14_04085 [Vibrio tubiashii]|uniref:hypothetical protein n=1 Tax=Vibrio tubiashii TaxID=29498 RepID=UPI001EFD5389|nr:hypothetical protein [Vibrio tubiashii]MCG9575410.1 hypothetical protein [Vibrio tubiashii]
MKNAFLENNEVVVGIDHRYNDNDGAYSIAHIWTGNGIRQVNYANGYNNGSFQDAEINASQSQIDAAADWYINNVKDLSYRDGSYTYLGCVVLLARSRKAPNNQPLKVCGYLKGGYSEKYGHWVNDSIQVEICDNNFTWVSTGCIKKIVKSAPPFWG